MINQNLRAFNEFDIFVIGCVIDDIVFCKFACTFLTKLFAAPLSAEFKLRDVRDWALAAIPAIFELNVDIVENADNKSLGNGNMFDIF